MAARLPYQHLLGNSTHANLFSYCPKSKRFLRFRCVFTCNLVSCIGIKYADPDPAFHFNSYPDPAFHLHADPDPAPQHPVIRICNHWSTDPPGVHFEPPGLHCERPLLHFEPLQLLNLTTMRIRIQLFSLILIRIRISFQNLCEPDPQPRP